MHCAPLPDNVFVVLLKLVLTIGITTQSTPNVIKKQQSDVLVTHVLADGETLDNEATGLSYRYDVVRCMK